MTLNRQKILNELGSVVNQLQSADCGCMGKMFSNPGQSPALGTPLPTCGGCRRGCCHGHGYNYSCNAPCAGDSTYSSMNRPCMGCCNPPKLYADTYSYLNRNLMQPVVNEVYNDLKSITPTNTIANNPMASQLGLAQGNPPTQGQPQMASPNQQPLGGGMNHPNTGLNAGGYPVSPTNMGTMGQPNQMTGNMNQPMGNMNQPMGNINQPMGNVSQPTGNMNQPMGSMNQPMGNMNQPMGNMNQPMGNVNQQMSNMNQPMSDANNMNHEMTGMGAEIVKMMSSGGGGKPVGNNPAGQLTEPMLIDAPQSPHGQVGVTPMNANSYQGDMRAHYTPENTIAQTQNPTTQYVTQPNTYTPSNLPGNAMTPNAQGNPMASNMGGAMIPNMTQQNMSPGMQAAGQMHANPAAPQMAGQNRSYGQHTAGISKFNEMFPGVMQGDLGFDPMAIAIQMNPANQQKAAMNTMQKVMMGGDKGQIPAMQTPVNAVNAVNASLAQSNNPPITQQQQYLSQGGQYVNQQIAPQQNIPTHQVPAQISPAQQHVVHPNQQSFTPATGAVVMNQQKAVPQPQYQTQPPQYQTQPQQQVQQQKPMYDPNTGAVITTPNLDSNNYGGMGESNAPIQQQVPPQSVPIEQVNKEPIFPVDTSKNLRSPGLSSKHYEYNTLGQPIELTSAIMYQHEIPPLPQTLSPQSVPTRFKGDPMQYSKVKNTMSKTSIMGNNVSGRAPSRSQLQHLYNQYKGSHSYTQQNIKTEPQTWSHSQGELNVNPVNPTTHLPRPPVERVGGDNQVNNINNNPIPNKAEENGNDLVASNTPQGDGLVMKEPPMKSSKCRNGLQDVAHTPYRGATAWTFHGHNATPFSIGYRFRSRV